MAKFFQVTCVRKDGVLLSPTTALYLNTDGKFILGVDPVSYQDARGNTNTGTVIRAAWGDGTVRHEFVVTQAATAVNVLMNAANTTDVHRLALTRKNSDGTTTSIGLDLDYIMAWQMHPEDNADTLLTYQNPTGSVIESIKVDETAASLLTAANA